MRRTQAIETAASNPQNGDFLTALPPFKGVPTFASEVNAAVQTVVDDMHTSLVEAFMPIYSGKQRDEVNLAFERKKKNLKPTIVQDVKSLFAGIHSEMEKIRV